MLESLDEDQYHAAQEKREGNRQGREQVGLYIVMRKIADDEGREHGHENFGPELAQFVSTFAGRAKGP